MLNPPVRKGEVWLANLPDSESREQAGKRPVVIMADADPATLAVIIPLTTSLDSARFPHTQKIVPSKTNGLSAASVALVFQLRAIDKLRLYHKIGEMDRKEMLALDEVAKNLLAL